MAKINRSYSTERSIVFYADGGVYVRATKIGGKIITFLSSEKSVNMEDRFEEAQQHGFVTKTNPLSIMKELLVFTLLLPVICGVATRNFTKVFMTVWFCVFALPHAIYLINTVFYTKYKKSSKHEQYISITRNHGAEHMARNFYNREGSIPTSEELMEESRICKNEVYNVKFALITMYTCIWISSIFLSNWKYYYLLLGIIFIVTLPLAVFKADNFGFMQLLVTMKPEDEDVELAREAISLLDLYLHNEEEAKQVSCQNLEMLLNDMLQISKMLIIFSVDLKTGETKQEHGKIFFERLHLLQTEIEQNYNICKKVANGDWMSQATVTGIGDFTTKFLK